jgi:predicted 2-oxoglutarate/Fe(II)-dependent dioxygenase YbiX
MQANAPSPGFGSAVPWFVCATASNPEFQFAALGGAVTALLFVGSLSDPDSHAAYEALLAHRDLFDDEAARAFAVSTDPRDLAAGRLNDLLPGVRWFRDFDGAVGRQLEIAYDDPEAPRLFIIDEALRVAARAPLSLARDLLASVRTGLDKHRRAWAAQTAPVLTVPRVLDMGTCRALVDYYERVGGSPSGFMRDVAGRTVGRHDPRVKRRHDVMIEDELLRAVIRLRIREALNPMLELAYRWRATCVERFLVACYGEEEKGFFRPHRDNTTVATRHRRFAVSINLNADFEGGELRFPEFGSRTYRPPPGGATVFACGLLHEATPVTRGRRFALLPFLYDAEDAAIRDETRGLIGEEGG